MSDSTGSMMTPWLHFGNMDYLIFKPWRPSSHGAVAGACIGLFLFSILERTLAAYRRSQELRWRARIIPPPNKAHHNTSKGNVIEASTDSRIVRPFKPSRDIPRGVIQAVQSTFSYALMLTVMTFNGAYIISVILGLGIGELLFGRVGREYEVWLANNSVITFPHVSPGDASSGVV